MLKPINSFQSCQFIYSFFTVPHQFLRRYSYSTTTSQYLSLFTTNIPRFPKYIRTDVTTKLAKETEEMSKTNQYFLNKKRTSPSYATTFNSNDHSRLSTQAHIPLRRCSKIIRTIKLICTKQVKLSRQERYMTTDCSLYLFQSGENSRFQNVRN